MLPVIQVSWKTSATLLTVCFLLWCITLQWPRIPESASWTLGLCLVLRSSWVTLLTHTHLGVDLQDFSHQEIWKAILLCKKWRAFLTLWKFPLFFSPMWAVNLSFALCLCCHIYQIAVYWLMTNTGRCTSLSSWVLSQVLGYAYVNAASAQLTLKQKPQAARFV